MVPVPNPSLIQNLQPSPIRKGAFTNVHVRLGSLKNGICTGDVKNTSRTAVVLERSLERVDTAGLQAISGRPYKRSN
jgi:hypothetical protein